jgi:hypothetical protein
VTLTDLASLGSFVSGVAVLASLVFLYFQVRQVTQQVLQTERNQRAILQQGRAARSVGLALEVASSASLADAVQRVLSGDADTPATAFSQFFFWASALVTGFEDTYFQHSRGMLDDEAFESAVAMMSRQLANESFRATWRAMRAAKSAGFREFVDQLEKKAAATPQAPSSLELWKAELKRGRTGRETAPGAH